MSRSGPPSRANRPSASADWTQVVVAGHSQITKVVVGKIVERSGLKPFPCGLAEAETVLGSRLPGVLIVDGGVNHDDCNALLHSAAKLRQTQSGEVPVVILLTNAIATPESLGLERLVDAIVAKPLTTERLQPVVDRLVARGMAGVVQT